MMMKWTLTAVVCATVIGVSACSVKHVPHCRPQPTSSSVPSEPPTLSAEDTATDCTANPNSPGCAKQTANATGPSCGGG